MSTVGCGLYGRSKCHVIPTQSPNCPTHRSLRAATRAAPTVDALISTKCGNVPAIDERRPRRGRIRLAPCRSEAQTWGTVSHRMNASSERANLYIHLRPTLPRGVNQVRPLRGRRLCVVANPQVSASPRPGANRVRPLRGRSGKCPP